MSAEIDRQTLETFTQATIKSATELEKIVSSLAVIVERQNKITDRLFNGMVTEIIDGVTHNYNTVHKETIDSLERTEKAVEANRVILTEKIPMSVDERLRNSSIARDIEHVKWFVAVIGLAVIITTIILRFLDNRIYLKVQEVAVSEINSNSQTLKHLLEEHMQETQNKGDLK